MSASERLLLPVLPGGVISGEVTWPRLLYNHYNGPHAGHASLLHGPIQVIYKAGWGPTAITEEVRQEMRVDQLYAWQHRVGTDGYPLAVTWQGVTRTARCAAGVGHRYI
jgi:hypothetical protein